MARITTLESFNLSKQEYAVEYSYLRFIPESKQQIVQVEIVDANKILSLLPKQGNVGIIVNTVNNAKNLYSVFASHNITTSLHHSQLLSVDRMQKDRELLLEIGKNAKETDELRVFVGTQLMEESLDIDFDLLITELCPMDKFLQRVGRLHRHDWKRRPKELTTPRAFVLEPDGEYLSLLGSTYVYGRYPLLQCRRILQNRTSITIPDEMVALLKESDTVPEKANSEEERELLNEYTKHHNALAAKASSAKSFIINRPKGKSSPILGWLQGALSDAQTGEEQGAAKVRDGISGIKIILLFEDDDGQLWVPRYVDGVREQYMLKHDFSWRESLYINGSSIKLPLKYNSSLDELEAKTPEDIQEEWKDHPILAGEIAIVVKSESFDLNETIISYDEDFGLQERGQHD